VAQPRLRLDGSQAHERDRAARERDRAADERDRAADERDRAERWSMSEREHAAEDRERAAVDRADAARDRDAAARDRESAGLDDLTGALRRDRGLADIEREINRARRTDGQLVLAFVDVDGLKAVNDTYGHAAGDQLLRDLVDALRAGLRSYDLVVRYGGDEFVCALPGADVETAQRRFRDAAGELRERNTSASISVGLAELKSGDTVETLLGRADSALYTRPLAGA
jgi:diguanylate cyclase (GGDEF)-like protein